MKLEIDVVQSKDDGRYIFKGPNWDDWEGDGGGIPFCIHGEKRRWQCDECSELKEKGK